MTSGLRRRQRARRLRLSEVITILIRFHHSHYRDFKTFYTEYVLVHWGAEFPGLVSYSRLVEFMPSTLIPLCAYLRTCCGTCTGISFLDSTTLAVCHNGRMARHKVFAGLAARGKNSVGWFFGFKLHLVFNDRGELLNIALTPGNVDDRKPVHKLVRRLFGKLFADNGYISRPLFEELLTTFGLQLITKLKRKMRNQLMPLADKLLLRKRAIAETIIVLCRAHSGAARVKPVPHRIDQLENISQVEHTRHRSPVSFLVNVLCGLIAYCHQAKKPSLHFDALSLLPA